MSKTKQIIQTHIKHVRDKLNTIIDELTYRAANHDSSKLKSPEIELWERMDNEPRYEYGSKDYFDKMKRNKLLFDIHYENNRHHPEHFPDGIDGMNLVDLLEFICDITSYKEVLTVADALELIDTQSKRFGINDQLRQILVNTVIEYFSTLSGRQNEEKTRL